MQTENRPTIVVSAITARSMGALAIVQDCLRYVSANLAHEYHVIALVHDRSLADFPAIDYLEIPKAKDSYLRRLSWEYVRFKRLSRRWKPYLWLSLHDITPNVEAARRAVYCDNAVAFHKLRFREVLLDPKFALFRAGYRQLYRTNLLCNDFVIVQQQWMKEEFRKHFGVSKVIVARPEFPERHVSVPKRPLREPFRFFYPSYARVFKNFEVIGRATRLLRQRGVRPFAVDWTVGGSENAYALWLRRQFGDLPNVNFLGLMDRNQVFERYACSHALIFPSKLESWGLPISEFRQYRRPMLLADLSYARETAAGCENVGFFPPEDEVALAGVMEKAMDPRNSFPTAAATAPPDCANWADLFARLLGDARLAIPPCNGNPDSNLRPDWKFSGDS